MIPLPSKSVPGGCVVGVLAVLPLTLAALGIVGMLRWFRQPADGRELDSVFWSFAGAAAGGLVLTALLAVLCVRILRGTDFRNYRADDPDENSMKW